MYVGGTTKELALMTQKETGCLNAYNENKDARLERKGDGFLLSDEQSIPEDYNTDESYGVVGFKVKFGSQNQSHFTSVNLDQSEFKNTQESLRTLELISQAGDTAPPPILLSRCLDAVQHRISNSRITIHELQFVCRPIRHLVASNHFFPDFSHFCI
jgi:hypothetical protein